MKKSDFFRMVRQESGLRADVVASVISSIERVVSDQIAAGQDVILPGLGRLAVKDVPARTARNPRTGEPLTVSARKRIMFRPAQRVKDRLRED